VLEHGPPPRASATPRCELARGHALQIRRRSLAQPAPGASGTERQCAQTRYSPPRANCPKRATIVLNTKCISLDISATGFCITTAAVPVGVEQELPACRRDADLTLLSAFAWPLIVPSDSQRGDGDLLGEALELANRDETRDYRDLRSTGGGKLCLWHHDIRCPEAARRDDHPTWRRDATGTHGDATQNGSDRSRRRFSRWPRFNVYRSCRGPNHRRSRN
jgi:hypothetical protein